MGIRVAEDVSLDHRIVDCRADSSAHQSKPRTTSWDILNRPWRDCFWLSFLPRTDPGFPARYSRQVCVCGFLHGKPHEASWFHQAAQEIRVPSWDILSRPCGTDRGGDTHPGLTSWATLSRPCGTGLSGDTHPALTSLAIPSQSCPNDPFS